MLYRVLLEEVVNPLSANWLWSPWPTDASKSCLGCELHGPNQNGRDAVHILLFADDGYILDVNWTRVLRGLRV
eukprot:994729-Amphidinium_carterae.1